MSAGNIEQLQIIDPDENMFGQFNQDEQSKYVTIDELNLMINNNPEMFTLLSFNIRSFNANISVFLSMLCSLSELPEVIVLTETWMTQNSLDSCNIEGYLGHHTLRFGRRSGGVSIFCRSAFVVHKIEKLCKSNDTIESCVVELACGRDIYVIFALYRPHSGTIENFNDVLLQMLLDDVLKNKKNIYTW